MARTGRRPGTTDTRATILDAARRHFSAHGYDRATIRGIAGEAGVDPALVHHYFGTKDALFAAALDIPVNPAQFLPGLLAEGLDGAGERIVTTLVTVWDTTGSGPLLMVLRSLAAQGQMVETIREFLTHNVLRPITTALQDEPQGRLRATLAVSQIAGLVMARYVLRLEPLASADRETVVRLVGPTIQRYFTGDIT